MNGQRPRKYCHRLSWAIVASLPCIALALPAHAQESTHVAGYERMYSSEAPSIAAGRLLLTELNCLSCHDSTQAMEAGLTAKPAPVLSTAGGRIHHDYFSSFLADPNHSKPGTTMPDVFASLSESDQKAAVKSISALLSSTGNVGLAPPLTSLVENGRELFHQVGCIACHQPIEDSSPVLATSTPLPQLDAKYSIPSLTQFLMDPLAVRSGGRMPHLGLEPQEAKSIASYLLKNVDVPAAITYRYYEGDWQNLPDFNALEPKSEGSATSFDLTVSPRDNQFALVFDSFVVVPQDGEYTFHLGSDDGARILLSEKMVVETDGVHPVVRKAEKRTLKQGVYPIKVQFFEQGGGQELYVEWEGPGLKRQGLESFLSATIDGPSSDEGPATATPQDIAKGEVWFAKVGCANCHDLDRGKGRIQSEIANQTFTKSSGGCLAGEGSTPRYKLSQHQKDSLTLAIQDLIDGDAKATSGEPQVEETFVRFNCVACHSRGEFGGVEPERNAWFKGTQEDVGDEGRLPPLLAGVGSKLNSDYFHQMLDKGNNDRFYMLTRMPGFGRENVGHLVGTLEELDQLSDIPVVETDEPVRRLKVAGRQLAGSKGQSCIKCHVFADYPATGIQAISLTTMTKRLKKDWFQKYMLNPNELRPGTRMPESWPGGATFFPDLLDGTANTQIHALWVYLEDANDKNRPAGLDTVGIELVASDSPIMYRNFIEGAGSRAIGVGYPEQVNLAYDANDNRLALIWQGSFIDASRHWTGRGQGYQPPLGDNIVRLPSGSALAILDDASATWPKESAKDLGIRFKGYRFDEARRPSFMLDVGGVRAIDQFIPIPDGGFPGLRRELSFEDDLKQPVVLRLIVANEINRGDQPGMFSTSDGLVMLVEGDAEVVSVDGNQELRLTFPANSGPVEAAIEYRW